MTVYEVVKASSGGSKALERIPSAIVPRNFEPGFKVRLMNKDLETFNTIAKELHVPVSFSNVAQRYQQAAMAAGLADMDTSVAMTIIERLAAIDGAAAPGRTYAPRHHGRIIRCGQAPRRSHTRDRAAKASDAVLPVLFLVLNGRLWPLPLSALLYRIGSLCCS